VFISPASGAVIELAAIIHQAIPSRKLALVKTLNIIEAGATA
jgi:hypothetical protein